MNDRINNIKLRSPKIRKLMRDIPSWLIRGGWIIIIIILLTIIISAYLMPYPHGKGESILRYLIG